MNLSPFVISEIADMCVRLPKGRLVAPPNRGERMTPEQETAPVSPSVMRSASALQILNVLPPQKAPPCASPPPPEAHALR
jgi:hypothetical protein